MFSDCNRIMFFEVVWKSGNENMGWINKKW